MKTLHLSIITIVAIASLVIVSTYIIFNPIIHPHSADIVGFVRLNQNQSQNQTNQTSTHTSISKIIIPDGSDDPNSGKNYEPRYLIVILGANNTVRWINNDKTEVNTIVAKNHDDPLFWNVTRSTHGGMLLPGKSFNFTFTNVGEFQYDTEPYPWLYGWVLVLPQSAENAINMVSLNTSSTIPGPCEVFRLPCPNNPNFTAQQLGANIYIEKVTGNGVDHYAVIHNSRVCIYPPSYNGYETCRNPDDLAILRLVGVDTSIPQENLGITINGLNSTYVIGSPINFGINVKGYGHCDFPSVLVIREGFIVWQSKTAQVSCPSTMSQIDDKYTMGDLGGPFYLNQSGTYTVHVGYASNMTEEQFNITSLEGTSKTNPIAYTKNNDPFGIIALVIYHPPDACLGPCPSNTFYLKTNSNSTAYLIGYNICDGDSCTKKDGLSILLPITDVLKPDFKMIPLPEDLHWKYGDAVHIEVKISSTGNSKTALLIDYGNSTIVP